VRQRFSYVSAEIAASMMIWLIFATLTAAALAAVLWPLFHSQTALAPRRDFDRAVFMDQLAELDRDLTRGVIGAGEADAARNEISRRLLAAVHQTDEKTVSSGRRFVAAAAIIAVPLIALSLYLREGAPFLPDVPLRERIAHATENNDFVAMVARVEQHLKEKPDDRQGWQVLAPAYRRMQRFDDAARAYERLVVLGDNEPNTLADLGEMIVYANEGMVTAEAAKAFAAALDRDAKNPKARYFAALALKQEGKAGAAVAAWKALLADSPADAPWRPMVDKEIAAVATEAMKPEDRDTMIRGMVDGLEAKLEANGDDLEGWQKLINARKVLGEMDKAKAAYDRAKAVFKDRPEALASLDELARSLSIQ
jgi:cytochrome c-type biogenesis protein CcmH